MFLHLTAFARPPPFICPSAGTPWEQFSELDEAISALQEGEQGLLRDYARAFKVSLPGAGRMRPSHVTRWS